MIQDNIWYLTLPFKSLYIISPLLEGNLINREDIYINKNNEMVLKLKRKEELNNV